MQSHRAWAWFCGLLLRLPHSQLLNKSLLHFPVTTDPANDVPGPASEHSEVPQCTPSLCISGATEPNLVVATLPLGEDEGR